jgi:Spy/CpxP family protein refolding chaperone
MRKYALPLLLVFSLAINIAAASTLFFTYWREHRCEERMPCDQKPWGRFLQDNLQLKKNDLSRFRACFSQDREEFMRLKKDIRQQRQILFNLLAESTIDLNNVDRQIEKISSLQAQMEKMAMKRIISIKSALPEQKQKKFLEIMRQRDMRGPLHKPLGPKLGKRRRGW